MDYVAEIAGAVGAHYCFDPRIVLGAGISDAPPRSWAHADRPAHLGSDSRPAADFRYRGVDKLMTEVETRDIPPNWGRVRDDWHVYYKTSTEFSPTSRSAAAICVPINLVARISFS
jgi:hypothetical protein